LKIRSVFRLRNLPVAEEIRTLQTYVHAHYRSTKAVYRLLLTARRRAARQVTGFSALEIELVGSLLFCKTRHSPQFT
jgi:hypothetical protein